MLFNSYPFLLLFLPASLVLYRIAPARLRIATLVLLSAIFYGYWNPRLVALVAVSVLANWLAARAFIATRRRIIITAAIIVDLAVLALFKYSNFVADNIGWLLGSPVPRLELALPLGISFFTFHHVMYLVDLRRSRAQPTELERYALYIWFFPQAIAGPLARWSEIGEQFGRAAFASGWERRFASGVMYVVIGLVEKTLLADPLGRILDPIYAQAAHGPVTDGSAWLALAFGFQIFFDFAGYSDIAIGLALMFGIELPQNFNAPLRSASILEFWQRWHMTLSRFFRDYVLLKLVDLRVAGRRHTPAHYVGAVMITMALCGLWHGAGWNFVIWGAAHGVAIVFALAWRRYLPSPGRLIGWAATMSFFLLSGVIFRTGTLTAAWHVLAGLSVAPAPGRLGGAWPIAIAALGAVVLPASRDLVERLSVRPEPRLAAAMGLAGVLLLVALGGNEAYEFIYFQF